MISLKPIKNEACLRKFKYQLKQSIMKNGFEVSEP